VLRLNLYVRMRMNEDELAASPRIVSWLVVVWALLVAFGVEDMHFLRL
jgi:hypothetical protein